MDSRSPAEAALAPLTALLAAQVAAAVRDQLTGLIDAQTPWIDVRGAADYLVTTEAGIRGLVNRREVPFTRTPNGRILFSRHELDAWARSAAA